MIQSTHIPKRAQHLGTVLSNLPICLEHFRLVLEVPTFPIVRPGQFLQLACRDWNASLYESHDHEWGEKLCGFELNQPQAFLRRPFSFSAQNGGQIEIIYRAVGVGTRFLAELKPGTPLELIGPLGNGFITPPPGCSAILIGGGVGIPPMIHLASQLVGRAVAICGATKSSLLPLKLSGDVSSAGLPQLCAAEFSQHQVPAILCTDDGSLGFKGYVTHALERHLKTEGVKAGTILYTCGPEIMMRRVVDIAKAFNIPCQVSVERSMACGMGTCQSCVIKVKKPDPTTPPLPGKPSCYRLACTDGPVFEGQDLEW